MNRTTRPASWQARALGLALAMCFALLVVPGAASASDPFGDLTGGSTGTFSPTIRSDKPDYAPGEAVVLTGDNWLPGEHVHIRVNDSVGQTWIRESDVNADETGSIRDEFNLPDSFIAEYAVTATGDASGTASTSFTDGNVRVRANFAAQVTETPYDQLGCVGNVRNTFPKTETANPSGGTAGVGVGNSESVRLDAAANANAPNASRVFKKWEAPNGDPFTTIPGTGSKGICVAGFQGNGTRDYRIVYDTALAVTAPAHQIANEGTSKSYSLGSFSDPSASSPWTVEVDWGDGSSDSFSQTATGTVTAQSHTYADDGTRTVTVKVTNDATGANDTKTFTVTVGNVTPVVTAAADQTASEGTSKSFTLGSFTDPGDDGPWAVSVDWGDGSAVTDFTEAAPGPITAQSHTYADDGEYTVTVKVSEAGSGTTPSDTKTFKVNVANVAPVVTAADDQEADEGSSTSFDLGSFTDPGADGPWAVSVDWGDGSAATEFTEAGPGAITDKSHTYADDGEYTVTVTVAEAGTPPTPSDSKTFKLTVANVAPTAKFTNDGPVPEGTSFKLALTDADDASSVDEGEGFEYAFNCGSGYGPFAAASEHSCATTDNGSHAVAAKIRDKDGGMSEYTDTVQVNNVAPTATFAQNGPVDEGQSFKLSLTNGDDVSSADETAGFTYAFDCGGGYGTFGTSSEQFCPTTDNGLRTVKGKIRDKDGGVREYTDTVTIKNVAPVITSFTGTNYLTGPLAYIGGGPSQSTFETKFTDPGADSLWSAAFTYSDGTPTSETVQRGNTDPFSVKHTFNGAGCAKTATVKVTDKDGDFDTKSTTVDVGTGAFLPPLANQPVADKLKNGQVLPVKIHLSDCSGAAVTNLTPAIRLVKGDKTPPPENPTDLIEPQSVSSADTTGVMRSIGGGDYIYNMRVDVPKADLGLAYTIVVYPYGTGLGQQLGHVIIAIK